MKRFRLVCLLSGLALVSFLSPPGNTQVQPPCPIPPTAVEASVAFDVTFSKASNLYTYKYTLTNSRNSPLKIWQFAIGMDREPSSITVPPQWTGKFSAKVNAVSFSARIGSDLAIGTSIGGFSFQSAQSPGSVKFYVSGNAEIPSSVPTEDDDEPPTDCPGFFMNERGLENTKVIGITQGPMRPGQISAKIHIHREEGDVEERIHKFDGDDQGFVFVTLFGSDQLNIANVDTSTVTLGPANAKPISTKIIGPAENNKASANAKKLVMKFNIKNLGLRCNIDRALFVSGKVSGSTFFGGAEVRPSICQPKPPPQQEPKKSKKVGF